MHEAMAYRNEYIQIILALSAPHCCQASTSLVGGVHWLNRVVSYFVRLDDTCLHTYQPAASNCDGTYLH
ncbi:unnamed protein product [Penicillium roqueforti FM164]|uniref:Str. FM013 n=2 Tax=Penicillium TaxID=5073 RepID=A0A0G4PQN6_PENC3|nr:unnamed protein product [Penicillium roqueforti FM164]CRL28441.1 unnamed protein product [Penicillium camemberti]